LRPYRRDGESPWSRNRRFGDRRSLFRRACRRRRHVRLDGDLVLKPFMAIADETYRLYSDIPV